MQWSWIITHQINITYKHYINIRINTRRHSFHLNDWGDLEAVKLLHSCTNKLQESRVSHRFANSPFATKRWKESTFAAKATKNHWEKVLACFFYCREPPCFCCFVCGEKRPFVIVQVSTVKVMSCLAGVVWCPGLAEAPMPGSLSRGTGQGEGGLHREALPEEKVLRQSWLQSGLGVKRR